MRAVSLEKAESPDYIKTLKYLYKRRLFRRSRINVDGRLVNALAFEKAGNADYIEVLKTL